MTRLRVAFVLIRSIPTAQVTTVACPYKELAGRVCMQIQERENALSTKENSSGGAQPRKLLLRRITFSSVHEFGGCLLLTLFFRRPEETFEKRLQKMFENGGHCSLFVTSLPFYVALPRLCSP